MKVEKNLAAAGVPLLGSLVYRGAPLGVPRAGDFPTIGHLTAAEVAERRAAFEGKDLRSPPPELPAEEWESMGVFEASEMFRDWVVAAHDASQGLVAFYY
jgi:hypothetical protein